MTDIEAVDKPSAEGTELVEDGTPDAKENDQVKGGGCCSVLRFDGVRKAQGYAFVSQKHA